MPIDLALGDEGRDEVDDGRRTYAADETWFDNRDLADDRSYGDGDGYAGGADDLAGGPDSELGFDELGGGAAATRWWGRRPATRTHGGQL